LPTAPLKRNNSQPVIISAPYIYFLFTAAARKLLALKKIFYAMMEKKIIQNRSYF